MPVPDRLVAAVADAGPLIHLDELDALPLLAGFTEVLVPAVVSTEVSWAARTGRLGAEEARTLIRAIPTQTTLHVRADLIEHVALGLDDA